MTLEIFNRSKYFKWYLSIMEKALLEHRIKTPGFHQHHIIPKSLGGDNKKSNLVFLTFREHFISHKLLCKSVISNEHQYKMLKALKFMMMHGQIELGTAKNSRIFNKNAKILNDRFSKAMSIFMTDYHKKYPEKFKRSTKSRAQTSKKLKGENNGMFGQSHSEDAKKQMSEKRIGRIIIYKDGIKKFIKKDEIQNHFDLGWIPNPRAIYQGKIDEKYLNVPSFQLEFSKWKFSDKIQKGRVFRNTD